MTNVVFTRLPGGEGALLDLSTGAWFDLNPTAARMWEDLAAGATEAHVAHRLVTDHGLSLADAADLVAAFVAELAAAGLR